MIRDETKLAASLHNNNNRRLMEKKKTADSRSHTTWPVLCRWRQTDSIRKTDTHLQSQVTLESQTSQQITVWQTALLWEQIVKPSQGLDIIRLHCRKGIMFSNSLQCCKDGVLTSKSKHGNSLINTMIQAYFSSAVKCCSPLYELEFEILQLNWNNSRTQMKQITKAPNLSMKYICYILSVMLFIVWQRKVRLTVGRLKSFYLNFNWTWLEIPQYNQ